MIQGNDFDILPSARLMVLIGKDFGCEARIIVDRMGHQVYVIN